MYFRIFTIQENKNIPLWSSRPSPFRSTNRIFLSSHVSSDPISFSFMSMPCWLETFPNTLWTSSFIFLNVSLIEFNPITPSYSNSKFAHLRSHIAKSHVLFLQLSSLQKSWNSKYSVTYSVKPDTPDREIAVKIFYTNFEGSEFPKYI